MRWVYVLMFDSDGSNLAPFALTFGSKQRAQLWADDWLERHPAAQFTREGDALIWQSTTAHGWERLTFLCSPLL